MKYFIIAGEASGDLHASHLMKAIRQKDTAAEFVFYGGELMAAQGGRLLRHYKDTAFMGFVPVLLNLRTILRNIKDCCKSIVAEEPHVVILIDYPGFNLKIAQFVKKHTATPVFYYISPKIWAWKEGRIRQIKAYVDELYAILPFEVPFYEQKHGFRIHYVGNPTVEEVADFKNGYRQDFAAFVLAAKLHSSRPIIALLPGSRQHEIRDNLPLMYRAAEPYTEAGYQIVVSCAPNISEAFYHDVLNVENKQSHLSFVVGQTYPLLMHAEAALVTSGTATLETALFRVPQVVCYYTPLGRLVSLLRRCFLKVPYVSLVNLIVGRMLVPELVADAMTLDNMRRALSSVLKGGEGRAAMLDGYDEMCARLGNVGCAERTAELMTEALQTKYNKE